MNTANLIQGLNRLASLREAAKAKRYKIIGECMSLECNIDNFEHTCESFDETCDILLNTQLEVLEAMIESYKFRIGELQYQADEAPVRELNPHND